MKNIADQQEFNEKWENLKTAIIKSVKETIQLEEKFPKNEWWDEKCRQTFKQKNITRVKCLQQKTRANQEHYKEKRKEAIKYVNKNFFLA